jgi:hypothetical protein
VELRGLPASEDKRFSKFILYQCCGCQAYIRFRHVSYFTASYCASIVLIFFDNQRSPSKRRPCILDSSTGFKSSSCGMAYYNLYPNFKDIANITTSPINTIKGLTPVVWLGLSASHDFEKVSNQVELAESHRFYFTDSLTRCTMLLVT